MSSHVPFGHTDPPVEGNDFATHPDTNANAYPHADDVVVAEPCAVSGGGGGKANGVTHPPNAVEMISHNGTASMEGSCSLYVNPTDELIDYTISEPYRYFLLVVGSCGCMLASFCYTFALFTRPMVMAAHMNMSDISSVATVMLVFSYFTLPYAFVFDHFGPKPVLIIGSVLLPLGCLLMALTFNGSIPASTVNFSVFLGIMGGGCIVFDIGTVVAVLSWFPTYRGPVVAVMKTFAGLGTAIVATIQHAFFEEDPAGFFFFLMATSLVLGVFTVFSMQLPPYHLTGMQEKHLNDDQKTARHRTKQLFLEQAPPRRRMIIGLIFVCFLIVYLPTQSAALAYADDVSKGTKIALAIVVIVVLALYPVICLPFPILGGMEPGHTLTIPDLESKLNNSMFGTGPNSFAVQDQHQHVTIAGEEMELGDEEEMEHDLDFIAPQFQTTFVQSLCTLHLWGIFAACFAIIGAQLVVIFHYPFLCAALRGKETDESFKTLLAALSGVGSALGRLILAWYENFSQHRPAEQRTPITVVLFVPGVTSLLGLVLYLVLPGDGIAAAHFIMSIGNGSAAAAAVLVFRGIFAKEPAKHYNFGFLAAMVSAIVLNRVVYGEWYQHEVDKPGTAKNPYTGTCLQRSCVLMPLVLMIGLNALAFIAIAYTHIAYTRFCRSVVKQRNDNIAEKAERRERRRRAAEEANAAEVVNDSILGALAEKREPVVPRPAEIAGGEDGSEDSASCFSAHAATTGEAVAEGRHKNSHVDANSRNN